MKESFFYLQCFLVLLASQGFLLLLGDPTNKINIEVQSSKILYFYFSACSDKHLHVSVQKLRDLLDCIVSKPSKNNGFSKSCLSYQ